ncbi:TPM domain-containing protein [Pedobacter lusitanus]|uniref:TPM domain-containing protein n=1 Tax=Pedobacter lusitanus TaxID=1503925 RepID=UPI0009E5067A|nr:TPM domain-containing protein [Pedobacter lusitanus]
MYLKKIVCLLLLVLCGAAGVYAQEGYTVSQIPNPKAEGKGYVSNPDMVLSSNDVDSLNHLIAGLENKTKVEIAVVVVRDFEQNEDPFNFGLNLFNQWGVGKGKANNGLLLFIATDRKQYRFITGYGLEGLLPDAALKRIGDHYLVPAFKEENYSEGTSSALNTIAAYLAQPVNQKELDQLLGKQEKTPFSWFKVIIPSAFVLLVFFVIFGDIKKLTPHVPREKTKQMIGYDKVNGIGCLGLILSIVILLFILGFGSVISWFKHGDAFGIAIVLYIFLSFLLFFRYFNALSAIRKTNTDDLNFTRSVEALNSRAKWYLIGSPLILLGILTENSRRKKSADRFKAVLDSQQKEMIRVDRNKNKKGSPYLTAGQLTEEKLGVNTYDIWVSQDQQEHKIIAYEGNQFKSFELCPQCNFRTLQYHKVIIVRKPTSKKEGEGKEARTCENCSYEELLQMIVIPVISSTDDDSSSSSSGSSDSSSSSSSSDSSWGGGSSGGGGAGGNW